TALRMRVPLSRVLSRENLNELGDVVFAPPPALLSGVVLSASGEPVRGVAITVEPASVPSSSGHHEWPWRALTDERGRFTVTGDTGETTLRVVADEGSTLSGSANAVARGTSDLLLRLPPAGRLAVRVILDPSFNAGELEF